MTEAKIENSPVSVTLVDNQTYSPASGSLQKLKIACSVNEQLFINGQVIIRANAFSGENNVDEITMIATDSDVIEAGNNSPTNGVHVSGFEVN